MNYLDTYNIWKSKHLEDPDLIAEMVDIEGNDHEIKERFVKMLEFGTAGLRGILGVGTNRMNIYTVALATQGMADYVKEKFENPSVAIAYDSRIKSDLFANVTARVFAANGVKAYLFKELMPTPTLSFAVRQLHCSAGIVIPPATTPPSITATRPTVRTAASSTRRLPPRCWSLPARPTSLTGSKRSRWRRGCAPA